MPSPTLELLDQPVWRALDVDGEGRVLAGNDSSGTIQLVELAAGADPRPLTALPGRCGGRYLPDERAVVVEHDRGGDERFQLSLLELDGLGPEPAGPERLRPLARDPGAFHNLLAVVPGKAIFATNRRNGTDFDVVATAVGDGGEQVLYSGGGAVEEISVSPDLGRAVLVRPTALPMSQQLLLVDVAQGTLRPLSSPRRHAQHFRALWLGRSRSLCVTSDRGRQFTAIFRLEPGTGRWSRLVSERGHDVTGWPSPDGRLLLALAAHDGAARLSLHRASDGRLLRRLHPGFEGWTAESPLPDPRWSRDSRYLTLSLSGPAVPENVLRIDARSGRVETLARSGSALAGVRLSHPRSELVPTPDGERIPCHVYPSTAPGGDGLEGSSVVLVHGGPESRSPLRYNPMVQALAGVGHTVLVPNVRGSVGYGKRWYSADDGRRRLDAVADLAAIHAHLPRLGLDPRRSALFGGSYGGYMVLAGLAFQPRLWAAGVDVVGISSLVTFLRNTSPYRRAAREREYGWLDRDLEFLERASPLSRAGQIRAPLLVIHGANDPRVPLSEAEQLVAAVRGNGVECELLVYPDEGHGLLQRRNRVQAHGRALEFLARHLRR